MLFAVAVSACSLAGCEQSSSACSPRKGDADLQTLRANHAAEDAAAAFKAGDHRFLGVYGFSAEIPGLTGDPYRYMSKARMLEGTGDVFCTKKEEQLNRNARIYAKKYNETMLSLTPKLSY